MIDFRYHLVSLIAVFIALAVGIVLGAGPLRGQLSDTLEGQVEELGAERNDLREQVELNDERARAKDDIIDALTPSGIAGVLEGFDVAVVRFPGSDADLGDEVAATLFEAGAETVTRVEVQPSWESGDDGARAEVVADVADDLDVAEDSVEVLAAVLAGGPSADFGSSPEVGSAASQLEQAGLVSVRVTSNSEDTDPALPGALDLPAQEAVLLLGGGPAGREPGDDRTSSVLQDRLDLVRALADTATAICVCGSGTETWQDPVTDAEDPLVAAVRADGELADEVSTVDNLESAAGRVVATWAVHQQIDSEAGHYGLAADADRPVPPPPATPEPDDGSLGLGGSERRPGGSGTTSWTP